MKQPLLRGAVHDVDVVDQDDQRPVSQGTDQQGHELVEEAVGNLVHAFVTGTAGQRGLPAPGQQVPDFLPVVRGQLHAAKQLSDRVERLGLAAAVPVRREHGHRGRLRRSRRQRLQQRGLPEAEGSSDESDGRSTGQAVGQALIQQVELMVTLDK